MMIFPIVVEYLKSFVTNFNANIQCDHGYAYSPSKQKICTWVNDKSCEMMKNCFPDENQTQKPPKNNIM